MAEFPIKDWKSQYLASVKDVFQHIEDHDSCLGKLLVLDQRYPRLRPLQVRQEKDRSLPFSGTLLEQAEVTKSSDRYFPSNVKDLFVPDSSGFVPKTVVLEGPHGIGKTTTLHKIMLDWASGKLYTDKFNFVFYLNSREINKIDGYINIASLVAKSSKLQCSEGLIRSAFNDPSKVLLLFDGFDEMRWTMIDDYEDCADPFQETHKETFLRCLFSRDILSEVSLIITTKLMSLQKMKQFVQSPCSVEILGFSERDLEQYLYNFFKNKDQADQASSVLKANTALLGLCPVPLTCWLVCNIVKAGMKSDLSSENCKTLTSVYLVYLKSLLISQGSSQSSHECLKKLCALANEGILNQKSLFDEEDLENYGLTISQVDSVFPSNSIFQRDMEASNSNYSFVHLSLQEFFAALYYVLGEEAEIKETNGASGDTFLPKVCQGRSLVHQAEHHPYLMSTARFLFGLLNDQQLNDFAVDVGFSASLRAKSAIEKWLMVGKQSSFCTDALTFFYEAQDEDLRRRAFTSQSLVFQQCCYTGAMENVPTTEMLYCLSDQKSFDSISLEDLLIRPKDLEQLSPFFHTSSKLCFTRCGFAEDTETGGTTFSLTNPDSRIQELEFHVCVFTPSFFEDLRSFLSSSRKITKLVLSHHNLGDAALKILCEGLCQPGSTLQELTLDDCNLTVTSCEILGPAIKANRSLQKLDMALNKLEDNGVKFLCEGLQDPSCTLQELRMDFSELTPACCKYLRSALMTNRSLKTLCMKDNDLQDKGAKLLCEALQQPGCTIKDLRLHESNITNSSCKHFQKVLLTNRNLTTLDLTYNSLQDSGLKILCEGLRGPGCALQELILLHCELSKTSCADLSSVFITNHSLTCLDLTWNNIEDSGVTILCKGLRDPGCTLNDLRLYGCDLTSSSLKEFSSIIKTNRSLTKLDLAGNKYDNVGVKMICDALQTQGCMLQEFRVGYCEMTASSAEDFLAVINTNHTLRELDVSFGYEDEEPPADLDSMCHAFQHPACTLEKSETQDGTFIYFKYKKQD